MVLQRLFIDSLLLTFHKLFHRFAVQSLSIASRRSRLGQGRGWLSRPLARWPGVATGLLGREEEGMAAGREGSLRVRDEQDIAGDWESGARRGQEEQGPARKDLSLWGREWLM